MAEEQKAYPQNGNPGYTPGRKKNAIVDMAIRDVIRRTQGEPRIPGRANIDSNGYRDAVLNQEELDELMRFLGERPIQAKSLLDKLE